MKGSELFKIMLENDAVAAVIDKATSYEAMGEIMTTMAPIFDAAYERGYGEGYDKGYEQGCEEGYNEGYHDGKEKGYNEGWNDGLDEKIY